MPDQSSSSISSELKNKIIKDKKLSVSDFEALKIYARNPNVCKELVQTPEFIEKLVEKTFYDILSSEGYKAIINIARNEPSSHSPIAKASGFHLNKLLLKHENLTSEDKFLLARLLFLISIEPSAAKEINIYEGIQKFVTETLTVCNIDSDDSESGKIVIELLRYRYNLVHNNLFDHFEAVKDSSRILKLSVSAKCVNIIGSCLNISLGKGPDNINLADLEIAKFMEILELFVEMYLTGVNKDYLGSTLLIALELSESHRSEMRRRFLPSGFDKINNWKKLLVVPDTSISYLTGEFLLSLCKENVARFLRHVNFESSAGFLYSKGIFKGGSAFECEGKVDPDGESSDEEYFLTHPSESVGHTPMMPETQEEADELEYLMKKITEYNSKNE